MDSTTNRRKSQSPYADYGGDVIAAHENTVLGYLLYDAGKPADETIKTMLTSLEPEHFISPRNVELYSCIKNAVEKDGRLPELQTVIGKVNKDLSANIHADAYGLMYMMYMGSSISFETSARRIIQAATAREMRLDAAIYASDLDHATTPEERQQAEAEHRERLDKIDAATKDEEDDSLCAALRDCLERLERGEILRPKYTTGFKRLDSLLDGGYPVKGLTILSARPSCGKTAFATQSAVSLAEKGTPTAIYSLEMAAEEIADRIVRQQTSVCLAPTQEELRSVKFIDAMAQMMKLPNFTDERPANLNELENRIEQKVRRHAVRVVFIDYLSLIGKPPGAEKEFWNDVVWLEHITKRLKMLAKRLEIAVVLLVQQNRESAKDAAIPPTMAGLRGSGGIEQNADVVLAIWTPDGETTRRQIVILKNRNGGTGAVDFQFAGRRFRFDEIDDADGTRYNNTQTTGEAGCISIYGTANAAIDGWEEAEWC